MRSEEYLQDDPLAMSTVGQRCLEVCDHTRLRFSSVTWLQAVVGYGGLWGITALFSQTSGAHLFKEMATRLKLEMDYSKCRFVDHEGTRLSEAYEPLADHLPKIKAMEIRDDDVMLCCYPKSGTHWLYRVIDMLQRGSSEYCERNLDSTQLEIQRIELISELASPRVLATHLPFDLWPQQIKDKRTKLVHVYRNPRAVLVSYCFMVNAFHLNDPQAFGNTSMEQLEGDFFSEKMLFRGWFGYMDTMSAFQKDNPDQPIIHVSYEEMTMNPLDTVKKLAEFLEKTVTPEFCAEVAEACSFKKQKQAEESLNSDHVPLKFYRKGDINDWKNHLTVALGEKFDSILLERAKKCPFSAKYIGSSLPHDH